MAHYKKPVRKIQRFTLDGTPEFFALVDHLGQKIDTTSRANTFRAAIEILDYVTRRVAAGHTMQFVSPTGKVEAVVITRLLPCMPRDTTPESS